MIDHTGLSVSDFARAREFYVAALRPLGYGVIMEFDQAAGLGDLATLKPDFWIGGGTAAHPPLHVAFRAADRDAVRKFYDAAIAAGGRDNGPPGLREHYHPNYYGAFVLDPDGNNIEAVCHMPP
ncbi:MAG TPA: VOC family protein [Steroidobacteraceae bacterium]|jgi:catechol 2,3-dioxygenase-like lactoylglutathione lyase family enzyme